jgi:SulP family sulfate permease
VLVITTFGSLIQAVGLGAALHLSYEKASDLGEKGIIIESVENLKDENRGKMNYLSMKV